MRREEEKREPMERTNHTRNNGKRVASLTGAGDGV